MHNAGAVAGVSQLQQMLPPFFAATICLEQPFKDQFFSIKNEVKVNPLGVLGLHLPLGEASYFFSLSPRQSLNTGSPLSHILQHPLAKQKFLLSSLFVDFMLGIAIDLAEMYSAFLNV